jgi:hypothetical protein
MAGTSPPRKVRRRTLDRLRQKLWAVPALLRLRGPQRDPAARQRIDRTTTIR